MRRPFDSAALEALESAPELRGVRVLLVDDESDTRQFVAALLDRLGAVVTECPSAKSALATLRTGTFDVLVSDIGMPEEDGYALIKKVRALSPEEGARIPAVALTAYARVEDRAKALRAGFQHHVTKPVRPEELVAVLGALTRPL
jgi:CheY-like chemotaxis protein